MKIKRKIFLPSLQAGIQSISQRDYEESIFTIDPKAFVIFFVIFALLIKILHLVLG
jgi:preprotein translocase subunit Sec61beta